MTLINLVIAGVFIVFACYAGYRVGRIIIDAVKLGIRQADYLEREFGADVLGAARHQFGGKKRE